jgi:hypothetical protein
MMRTLGFACLLFGASALIGCVSDRAYRQNQPALQEKLRTRDFDPTQPNIGEHEWPYTLAFLEFADDGTMFDPAQLTRILEQIDVIRRAPRSASTPLVTIFVHGWKNNASDSSGNVWGFRQTLAGLSLQEGDAPVLGIYVGWRGATVSAPILKEFTFFERHPKSQTVGQTQMVDALGQIVRSVKAPGSASGDVRLAMIGHSFGGAVLEAAVTPLLMEAIDAARKSRGPEPRRVTWPADLIVLLNEAQEAERSYPLLEEMHRSMAPRPDCKGISESNKHKRPAVISISSQSDYATRAFFPGAQMVGRIYNRPAYEGADPLGAGKRRLYYSTTAHLPRLQSHRIGRRNELAIQTLLSKCPVAVLQTDLSIFTEDQQYVLVEDRDAVNKTPYWVTWMPGDIVPDHSTIFTQIFRDYLIALLFNATRQQPHDELKPLSP